jgi:hypothetical protein
MWLSKIGAGIVDFFRAGYPDTFPRTGFSAAAALLPLQIADGEEQPSVGKHARIDE